MKFLHSLTLLLAIIPATWAVTGESSYVLADWQFTQPGELDGWRPNADVTNVKVANGSLHCETTGADPILEYAPSLSLKASPWQVMEIRVRASRGGTAELFWSNTREGKYSGFSQELSTRFPLAGGPDWQTCRVFPFWQAQEKIVRLRLDLYDGAAFDVDFVRIVELARPGPVAQPEFIFTNQTSAGWQGWEGMTLRHQQSALEFGAQSAEAFLFAPPVIFKAETAGIVSLQMSVEAEGGSPSPEPKRATLLYATRTGRGWHQYSFPLQADGLAHIYNLDMLGSPEWRGDVIALGLRPPPGAGAGQLSWFRVSDRSQGPAEVQLIAVESTPTLPRAGLPLTIRMLLTNRGGTRWNGTATIEIPERMADASSLKPRTPLTLSPGDETDLHWTFTPKGEGPAKLSLVLRAKSGSVDRSPVALQIRPAVGVRASDYMPEPKPARGAYEVGVYYFPGWKSASQWEPLRRFPERKPLLGWYAEGDPEIADWHIKWAVEHGITFFAYDWYWARGARQLEHALHDGYFKARFRHLLKFCLLWANHNAPGSSSVEDCLAVTRHWIAEYFRRPEHLTVDGKPVMIIFSPERLTHDLGSSEVKRTFELMRAECRTAGLKGLYLLACVAHPGQAPTAAAEGYDAITCYNWAGLGLTANTHYGPYATLIEGYRRTWEQLAQTGPLPLLVPLSGGWDSRPWHGENNLVRFGRTPELFRTHLQQARDFLGTNADRVVPKMVLIEAWNEWGEGSYIEPHAKFGFGYLDAILETFTDTGGTHPDLTPEDIGRTTREVPALKPGKTTWDFAAGIQGWDNTMDMTDVAAASGNLRGRSSGNDPAFFGPPMRARANDFQEIEIRMKLSGLDDHPSETAQLFWRTAQVAESEASSIRFSVQVDGAWHTYRVPVWSNPRWRGLITRLRLDPGNRAHMTIDVQRIHLVP